MNIKLLSIIFGVVAVLGLGVWAVHMPIAPKIENAYPDLIQVDAPSANAMIISPLTATGKARGTWYFEASFPIKLVDANNVQLGATPAQAQSSWMTEDFVPFKATLAFATPSTKTGTLILQNDNPSGDPTKSKTVKIPVQFSNYQTIPAAEFGKSVLINLNNQAIFPDGLLVTLEKIDDSRCAKGVVCIWQGELSVAFMVSNGAFGVPGEEIHLSTVRSSKIDSHGYTFSLVDATKNSVTLMVAHMGVSNGSGGVSGYIHAGPTCPVERIPPDPNCADKPYVNVGVSIETSNGALIMNLGSDANGNFKASLAPGIYTVMVAETNTMLPRCEQSEITIEANKIASVDISCDTGIR